jgi:hypothetical protein
MAKVDAEAPLAADKEADAAKPAAPARQLDPEEDDELLTELERAAASAVKATEATQVNAAPPPPEPAEESRPASDENA